MSSINRDQMRAAEDLLTKLSAVTHYGEHEGHEVVMTAFVAEVLPAEDTDPCATDCLPPKATTELFFVHEGDEWVLAEINDIGRSFK